MPDNPEHLDDDLEVDDADDFIVNDGDSDDDDDDYDANKSSSKLPREVNCILLSRPTV